MGRFTNYLVILPDSENVHAFCVLSVLLDGIHNIYT